MIFYVSNTHDRSLELIGTLHLDPGCFTLGKSDRRGWPATPAEIVSADVLCGACVKRGPS